VSARALNRAVLARQMLLERVAVAPLAAIEALAGMQAQAPNPPYVGLWTRLVGFRAEELSRLILEREAVRIALMRSTLHLVSAADCLAFRPLLQPAMDRATAPSAPAGKDLAGLDLAEVAAAGRALVEDEPRTMAELGALLAERWPDRDPSMLTRAVRALVPLVQVPPRGVWGAGGPATCTSAERWLGRPLAAYGDRQDGLRLLMLRYLAAFGPASVRDAQAWSGLTGLREPFAALRPQLRTFRDEQGRELYDLPDAPRPDPDTPAPVRFLPDFDNVLIGYADWTRIIDAEQRRRVFGINGVIRGTVLVDGTVHGMWRIQQRRPDQPPVIQVEPLAKITAADQDAIAAEGDRLLAFATPDAPPGETRFEPW
jgi:winged helix DNA-binding protein